jgi:hypothetical protein
MLVALLLTIFYQVEFGTLVVQKLVKYDFLFFFGGRQLNCVLFINISLCHKVDPQSEIRLLRIWI